MTRDQAALEVTLSAEALRALTPLLPGESAASAGASDSRVPTEESLCALRLSCWLGHPRMRAGKPLLTHRWP